MRGAERVGPHCVHSNLSLAFLVFRSPVRRQTHSVGNSDGNGSLHKCFGVEVVRVGLGLSDGIVVRHLLERNRGGPVQSSLAIKVVQPVNLTPAALLHAEPQLLLPLDVIR